MSLSLGPVRPSARGPCHCDAALHVVHFWTTLAHGLSRILIRCETASRNISPHSAQANAGPSASLPINRQGLFLRNFEMIQQGMETGSVRHPGACSGEKCVASLPAAHPSLPTSEPVYAVAVLLYSFLRYENSGVA